MQPQGTRRHPRRRYGRLDARLHRGREILSWRMSDHLRSELWVKSTQTVGYQGTPIANEKGIVAKVTPTSRRNSTASAHSAS